MSPSQAAVLIAFALVVYLMLRTAMVFDTTRRELERRGSPESARLALGIFLVSAGAGLQELWWLAFQAQHALGVDSWWMQAHKPSLVPLAVLSCAGYLLHLHSYHQQRGRPRAWLVELAVGLGLALGLCAATVAFALY